MEFNTHTKTPRLAAVLIGCGFLGIVGLISLASTLTAGAAMEGHPSVEFIIANQVWWVIIVMSPIFMDEIQDIASFLKEGLRKK